ncbi:uncharacterized protein BP5553_10568 [Venustampulla echinocandica]|uniref:RNA polymerase II transcription factor SIII subunit A n=1 Tax=Venustampulla echinocandica TaxID=2656787 RepID=A0A370T8Y4_9HELO|nr:uncharacterized protein BP5553_10568 [Venustampulla echinocandica]RDL29941.1 hypothetical protein BP5553_10568 [Venustampulla echinocandica]
MPGAPSLVHSSTKACIKNIRSLTDVGDLEYWKIRSILQRVQSAEQLHQLEINSPQLKGEDAELWRAFIARDIPKWRDKNYTPKNPLKWYEVYCKYKKEQRIELARDQEKLEKAMMEVRREKETHVTKVVDLRMVPKVPKDPRMMANNGGVPLGRSKGFAKPAATSLTWGGGSKTKVSNPQNVLTKARREAKELSQRSKLSTPTHQLMGSRNQVRKAPAGMVNEYRKAAEPPVRILSRRKNIVGTFDDAQSGPSLEERENRLRALTMGSAGSKRDASGAVKGDHVQKITMVGSSDEDTDDEDKDDLFGEKPQPRQSPAAARRPARPAIVASSPSQLGQPRVSQSAPPPTVTPSTSMANKSRPSTLASSPPVRSGTGSPAPKPMMPRRKAPVDIFNRGPTTKRPRLK